MPLYDFECDCGNEFECILSMNQSNDLQKCPKCGEKAFRIIKSGHGGLQCDDEPSWLASACQTLLRPEDPPLRTRGEYKAYLKEHGVFERG